MVAFLLSLTFMRPLYQTAAQIWPVRNATSYLALILQYVRRRFVQECPAAKTSAAKERTMSLRHGDYFNICRSMAATGAKSELKV